MSVITSIPWICGAIGYFGGGLAGDFIYRRMESADQVDWPEAALPTAPLSLARTARTSFQAAAYDVPGLGRTPLA